MPSRAVRPARWRSSSAAKSSARARCCSISTIARPTRWSSASARRRFPTTSPVERSPLAFRHRARCHSALLEMPTMEPLPKGANFVRAKTLWEIGLHIAGNPATPYGGNRDLVITVGSGSGEECRPWLRLASGSAILAEEVAKGGLEAAFVNPSALLTQAYRGVGLFRAALPVRIIASYPSWDRFVFMVHPRSGIRSLKDIKAKQYPLRVSVREDPTHSTLVLIEQAFALHGLKLPDIEAWGGRIITCGGPTRRRRLEALGRARVEG